MILSKKRITKALIRLRGCAGWSAPVLFANPRRQVFSRCGPFESVEWLEMVVVACVLIASKECECAKIREFSVRRFLCVFKYTSS